MKTNYQTSNAKSIDKRIDLATSINGLDLPCIIKSISDNGSMVVINYIDYPAMSITIPVQTSKWACVPLKVGDKGIAKSIDIMGVSKKANLSSRVFVLTGQDSQSNKNNDYFTIRTRISDNEHSFTPTQMYTAFAAFVSVFNNHVHNGGDNVDVIYSGGNIASQD